MRPEQLHALGLELSPFEQGPAGKFFFSTPALTQRLDLLHHLVQHSDLLLVVTAPNGGGKTSVLAKVLQAAGPHWRLCPITIDSAMGVNALLDRVMAGIDVPGGGAPGEPPESRLVRLATQLETMVSAGDVAAIFIDDADRLEDDGLELLVQLAIRSPHLKARIVLSGSSTLAQRLRSLQSLAEPDEAKELVHVVDLPAFSEEHTGDYLHTRLRVAGMVGDSPFTPAMVTTIRRESKGRPSRINELALLELSRLAERRDDDASRSGVSRVLMQWWKGLAVVAVALLLLAVAIVVLPRHAPTHGPAAPPPQIVDIAKDGKAETDTALAILGDPVPAAAPGNSALNRPDSSAVDHSPRPGPAAAPLDSHDASPGLVSGPPRDPLNGPSATPPVRSTVDAENSPAARRPPPNSAAARGLPIATGLESSTAANATEVKATRPGNVRSEGSEKSSTNPLVSPVPQPPTQRVIKSPVESGAKIAPATSHELGGELGSTLAPGAQKSAPGPIRTATWLRAQPPGNFTIQLIGTHDAHAMDQFIERTRIGPAGAWFRTTHQNKPWYVVVYGSYSTQAKAQAAAAALPPTIVVTKPWVRSLSNVVAGLR